MDLNRGGDFIPDVRQHGLRLSILFSAAAALCAIPASAADYPLTKDGNWIAKEFKFHDGASLIHWKTQP